MGSIGFGFGRERARQTTKASPFFKNTGFSSYKGRTLKLDPSIRRVQDESLGQLTSAYGDIGEATGRYTANAENIRSRYLGNEDAYMKARVNPVVQARERALGETQRNLGRRNLSGSSFYDNAISDVNSRFAQEEGDVRALATNERFAAEMQMNESELAAVNDAAMRRAQITGESLEVAKTRLMQEFQAFGIGTRSNTAGSGNNWNFAAKFGVGGGGGSLGGE